MAKPVGLVIFDLDGTLLDTGTSSSLSYRCSHRAGAALTLCSMCIAPIPSIPARHVALRHAESLVCDVSQRVLAAHGASLTPEAAKAGLGKRPIEAWQAVVDTLGLAVPAQQLYDESEPLLSDRQVICFVPC